MKNFRLAPTALCLVLGSLWLAASAVPQAALAQAAPVIYPAKGQAPQQQDRDRYECHDWARAQSGHDPVRASPASTAAAGAQAPSHSGSTGAMARGAAGGAAIAELSSKDVGHGAAAGLLGAGLIHKAKERQAAQARQQQQPAAQQVAAQQMQATYGRAFSACLEGRGYVVR